MDRVKDVVCGMIVDPDTAAAQVSYEGRELYFCSEECKQAFEADPEVYAAKEEEPPFTVTKGMAAPKFGSAGSGGLEHEP